MESDLRSLMASAAEGTILLISLRRRVEEKERAKRRFRWRVSVLVCDWKEQGGLDVPVAGRESHI